MKLVLLLEDHDALRRSMAEALSGLPEVEVVAVGTLRDGMEALARRQPDLVVSDLDLPDGSGIELLGYLGRPPAVPVLFVSGHVPQYQAKLHGFPGITVRHKPIALRELQDLALEHLESMPQEAPFNPSDYIQLACMGRHSVRIEVDGAKARGVIVVNEGQLWSANCGAEEGMTALRRLSFDTDALTRCVTLRTVRTARNLPERSWEQILLDVARAYDEARRAVQGGRERPGRRIGLLRHLHRRPSTSPRAASHLRDLGPGPRYGRRGSTPVRPPANRRLAATVDLGECPN